MSNNSHTRHCDWWFRNAVYPTVQQYVGADGAEVIGESFGLSAAAQLHR